MSFQAAVVREQGLTFVVVAVKPSAVNTESDRQDARAAFAAHFPGEPIILMVQDGRGRATFWGRQDIVRFLSKVPVARLPWRQFSR